MTQAIIKLGGSVLENTVSDKTTHVITPNVERTMNILRGVISACFILKLEWIFDSLQAGKFVDTTIYHHEICNPQKVNLFYFTHNLINPMKDCFYFKYVDS